MTLYEQLEKLEKKSRANGFEDVADRIKKMIEETPIMIGVLQVENEGDN